MDDDETWLSPGLSSTTTSSSKGTQSDLDSWLNTTASAIDFSTRSALSRKLKGYSEKKARRRQLRSASTVSLESVSEESHRTRSTEEDVSLLGDDVTTLRPLAHSSPHEETTVDGWMERGGRSFDSMDNPFGDDDEEYKKLEEAALGLSMQSEGGGEVEGKTEEKTETTQLETTLDDDDEFLSAASEFEDEELQAAHNGRARELESLDEEPGRSARQLMSGTRLGVTPRSSSVSPRLTAVLNSSTPKTAVGRVDRVAASITSTPVGTMNTLSRRPTGDKGGMSVSLHLPTGHLPPRRIPPGRENNGKNTTGGGGGTAKDAEKKVNLHEDLAKIQDLAREQEEALRREVMGSLSANDVSNGENDSRIITNSKSVEFVGKKEFHSRLPTPSRRVIPVRTRGTPTTLPLTSTPNSVVSLGSGGGGGSSVSQSRPTTAQNDHPEDDCF